MKESVIIMTEFNAKHATAMILTLSTLGTILLQYTLPNALMYSPHAMTWKKC